MSNTRIGAYRVCKMRAIYHRAISHRFDGIMHQTMLIWKGGGRAKAVDLDSKHFFSGQMPYPSDIIFGQKRTNSPSLQPRLEVKCVSLKVATYQHFEKTSSALKCCLYIKKAHQFCQLTFIGVQQNAIFLNFMEQTFKIDRMIFSIFIRSSTFSNFYCELS